MNLKHLTQNNGYWQYNAVCPRPFIASLLGAKKSKTTIGTKNRKPVEDVLSAWKSSTKSLSLHWQISKNVIHTSWTNVSVDIEPKPQDV